MGGRLKLGQILVNRGLLDPDQLAAALADQQETGARLGMTLVRMGFVDEETLIRTLAGQVKLPVARIRGKRVSADVLECVPVELAEKHRCLPLFFKQEGGERVLFVAMEDPSDDDAIDAIASDSGQVVRPVLVGPTELEEALQRHYHWASLTGETPGWLAERSPRDGDASGDSEPDPVEASEGPALPEAGAAGDREGGDAEWAGEPDSRLDEDEDEDLAGDELGLDFDSDPLDESGFDDAAAPDDPAGLDAESQLADRAGLEERSGLDDDPDPVAGALLPGSPDFGDLGAADTAPELPQGSDDDADDRLEFDDDLGLAAPAPARSAQRLPRPESLDPGVILRALSQLLVEKGVISRDELVQRLGELAAREASRG